MARVKEQSLFVCYGKLRGQLPFDSKFTQVQRQYCITTFCVESNVSNERSGLKCTGLLNLTQVKISLLCPSADSTRLCFMLGTFQDTEVKWNKWAAFWALIF